MAADGFDPMRLQPSSSPFDFTGRCRPTSSHALSFGVPNEQSLPTKASDRMRNLLPILILLLAGGAAFLLFRRESAPSPVAITPGVSSVTPDVRPAPPTELARETPVNARAVAAAPAVIVDPTPKDTTRELPAQIAAENEQAPAIPEPSLEGGVTFERVGIIAANEQERALKLKYSKASRPERVQALESLRTMVTNQQTNPDKNGLESLPALKFEMSWLETNLDG